MSFELLLTVLAFFIVAVVYSSAGFGGGSSYLAILSLIPTVGFGTIRTTALICNIVVVGGSLIVWTAHNKWSKEWILKNVSILVFSVPLAYIAGSFRISEKAFFILLGLTLVFSSLVLFFKPENLSDVSLQKPKRRKISDSIIGGFLGGMAGLVGIGGGIFLAPYLYFTRWDYARKISIATSLFILCNSLAGLSGQLINRSFVIDWGWALPLVVAVLLGGQLGIRLNMSLINDRMIKRVTAILIFIAGLNSLTRELLDL